jgi:hypothetical protein
MYTGVGYVGGGVGQQVYWGLGYCYNAAYLLYAVAYYTVIKVAGGVCDV